MKLNLNNLVPEGNDFQISQLDETVKQELKDLVGDEDFTLDIHLKPLGDAVEMTGKLKAFAPVNCSFCDESYNFSITEELKAYLVVTPPPKSPKAYAPGASEAEEEVAYDPKALEDNIGVEYDHFNPAVYLRDRIGFAIPFQVPCKTTTQDCENYAFAEKALLRHQAPEMEDKSPFSALSDLKVDKKR